MYFSILRGRQEELLAIREAASLLVAKNVVVPVIEPVNQKLKALQACLNQVAPQLRVGVIVNPQVGDLRHQQVLVEQLVASALQAHQQVLPIFRVTGATPVNDIMNFLSAYTCEVGLFHGGELVASGCWAHQDYRIIHLLEEAHVGQVYAQNVGNRRVVIRDGFIKRARNLDYPTNPEFFSDKHLFFKANGLHGFGDYSTVGSQFIEGGSSPLAVAIHLTHGTSTTSVFCHHFLSTTNNTTANTAGKYAEALLSLNTYLQSNQAFFRSSGVAEFQADHTSGHFPGLGRVKRRSIKHHLELMNYLL